MVSAIDIDIYRQDTRSNGRLLSAEERAEIVKPYLPPAPVSSEPETPQSPSPSSSSSHSPGGQHGRKQRKQKPIRAFLKPKLHYLVYFLIHLIFGIYIRIRQTYHAVIDRILALLYYHHRTPELIQRDVRNLSRLPEHLSVIITLKGEEDGGLEALVDDVAELSAWCASAGIPLLSVYEKTGILKPNMRSLHTLVSHRLSSYFGFSTQTPKLRLHAPSYPSHPDPPKISQPSNRDVANPRPQRNPLDLHLLSSSDGRDTLVDLSRTLAEMSQSGKLHPSDITQDLIDAEISSTTSIHTPSTTKIPSSLNNAEPQFRSSNNSSSEPDLLIIFGPYVRLDGYPPWQIRLTEIFCVGDPGGGNSGRSGARVEYQAFLRAMWKFAGAEMRFGR